MDMNTDNTVTFNIIAGYTAANPKAYINGQYVVMGTEEFKKGQNADIRGRIIPADKITSSKSVWKHVPELNGYRWVTTINFRG